MFPERIVCLTEETTETLYLLGEERRIAGISGFTVRPPRARREKPKVAAFTSAKIDKILDLRPDLVLGFSDLQADIAADLIRRGVAVHVFNQRSVAGIFAMMRTVGGLVGAHAAAEDLVTRIEADLQSVRRSAAALRAHPRVYFEEWDDPPIAGIRWVSELVEIAGGADRRRPPNPCEDPRMVAGARMMRRRIHGGGQPRWPLLRYTSAPRSLASETVLAAGNRNHAPARRGTPSTTSSPATT